MRLGKNQKSVISILKEHNGAMDATSLKNAMKADSTAKVFNPNKVLDSLISRHIIVYANNKYQLV